jgi:hypothetical protein
MDDGTLAAVVVPFGADAGMITSRGVVVGQTHGGIDGHTYHVREADGQVVEHAASWVRRLLDLKQKES